MIADAFHCRFNTGRDTKEQRYKRNLFDRGLCAWCRKPRGRDGRYCHACREIHRINSRKRRQQAAQKRTVCIALVSEHTGYTPDEVHELAKQMFLPKRLAVTDTVPA